VIVVKGVNAVDPGVGPVVGSESFLNPRRIFTLYVQYAMVKKQWIMAVWNYTVVLEKNCVRLNQIGSLCGPWANQCSPAQSETNSEGGRARLRPSRGA
jgi:hypothetical protein